MDIYTHSLNIPSLKSKKKPKKQKAKLKLYPAYFLLTMEEKKSVIEETLETIIETTKRFG
jgi:hypothetical protein